MTKCLIFLFIALLPSRLFTTNLEKKGIVFFEGTWQEALQQSDIENKHIFLDLSTSWCGWCKKMKQGTYPDEKVGEYFNARFINVALDAETGEGRRLARKYGVTSYPATFIIDHDENQILSSEGYNGADDLLKLVRGVKK